MSCTSAAARISSISRALQPERGRDARGELDDRLGVLARVAVALEQRDREARDRVVVALMTGRVLGRRLVDVHDPAAAARAGDLERGLGGREQLGRVGAVHVSAMPIETEMHARAAVLVASSSSRIRSQQTWLPPRKSREASR